MVGRGADHGARAARPRAAAASGKRGRCVPREQPPRAAPGAAHLGQEAHFGRAHRVVVGAEELELKGAALERSAGRPLHDDVEVAQVVLEGRGADALDRVLDEALRLLRVCVCAYVRGSRRRKGGALSVRSVAPGSEARTLCTAACAARASARVRAHGHTRARTHGARVGLSLGVRFGVRRSRRTFWMRFGRSMVKGGALARGRSACARGRRRQV